MIVSGVNFPMINDHSVAATLRAPTHMNHNTRRSGADRESPRNIKAAVLAITAEGMIPHPILAIGIDAETVRPRFRQPHLQPLPS
jgi:hypothetical protein